MKRQALLLTSLIAATCFSCGKKSDAAAQTKIRLQYKWTMVSERLIFPDTPGLGTSYIGNGTDYYQFGSNDTVEINMAGTGGLPTTPFYSRLRYSVPNSSTLLFDAAPNTPIQIRELTDHLLVFSNAISYTHHENGTVTVYNGTRLDSLSK